MTNAAVRPTVAVSSVPTKPRVRERLARRPLNARLLIGLGILGAYLGIALSAIAVFWGSLGQLGQNAVWIPGDPWGPVIGPSWAHPFGVLPGLGVDVLQALWQATPWDLGIVATILLLDLALGWTLGSLAGMNEGGWVDFVVTLFSDSVGAIPSFFLVVVLFGGLTASGVVPGSLPVFIALFGLVLWPATARTTRERAREAIRQPYIEAARASGAGRARILRRHVMPASVPAVLAQIPVDVAPIFFVLTVFPWFWDCASLGFEAHDSAIYFLPSLPGFSPLPSVLFPEWGNILAVGVCEGFPLLQGAPIYWWMFVYPFLAIVGLGIGITLVCDGIDRRMNYLSR
jgi:peptide/nickel transport system permease protein